MADKKVIDITNTFDYLTLDDAIDFLESLRDEMGGKARLEISQVPVRFEDYDEIEVKVTEA